MPIRITTQTRNGSQEKYVVVKVRPSSVTIFHPREHTTKREALAPPNNQHTFEAVKEVNVTFPLTAGKFTRVFDSKLHLGQPHNIQIKSSRWLQQQKLDANKILKLTPDDSILYLSGLSRKLNTSATLRLEASATRIPIKPLEEKVLIILQVTFEPFSKGQCLRHQFNCAEFSLENECSKSCGFKSGASDNCQWIPEGYVKPSQISPSSISDHLSSVEKEILEIVWDSCMNTEKSVNVKNGYSRP